ncbi:MAG TPA: hypothetical protein GX497_01540 [Bacillus bacterium]|nr:hypothetical protein [Bacillus sp. (in: firmicutes)]
MSERISNKIIAILMISVTLFWNLAPVISYATGTFMKPGAPMSTGQFMTPGKAITGGTFIVPGQVYELGQAMEAGKIDTASGKSIVPRTHWQNSIWKMPPEWQNSAWQTAPEWNLNQNDNNPNNGNNPNQNGPNKNPNNPTITPDGSQPIPDVQQLRPPYNPDYTNPGIAKSNELFENVKPLMTYTEAIPNDDLFFNFNDVTMKDALKITAKDVIGGTIKTSIEVVTQDKKITPQDFLKGRTGIFTAGFKTFTKGDPTVDFLYNSKDIVDGAKGIYDNYNTYKDYKTAADLGKLGNMAAAAAKYDEIAQAGKAFSTGNAVVSAISMPFTIYDTVENVGKFKGAKTSDEKWASGMDLVGNAGSIISGAAAGVALIPGAQSIAAGMLIVGGTLSLVSLGHKIYRNREKLVKDVKKKFKKGKEKVAGFFKSTFGK